MVKLTKCRIIGETDGSLRTSKSYLCQDSKYSDTKYLVKYNSLSWTINDFVTNKIAQVVIGHENIQDVKIITDKKGNKPLLKKLDSDFFDLSSTPESKFNKLAGGYDISLNFEEISKNKNSHESTYNGKPVKGFWDSYVLSSLTFEGDIHDHMNFALLKRDTHYQVIRYDFDDSLKFFDKFDITPIKLMDTKSSRMIYKNSGITKAQVEKMLTDGIHSGIYLPSDYFIYHYNNPKNSQQKVNLKDALSSLIEKKEDVFQAINEAYDQLKTVFTNEELESTYYLSNFDIDNTKNYLEKARNVDLQKICQLPKKTGMFDFIFNVFGNGEVEPTDKSEHTLDEVKAYTECFISRRFKELEQLKLCLDLKFADNKHAVLEEFGYSRDDNHPYKAYTNSDNEALLCKSNSGNGNIYIVDSTIEELGNLL